MPKLTHYRRATRWRGSLESTIALGTRPCICWRNSYGWTLVPGASRPPVKTRSFQEDEPFVAVPIDCDVEKDFEPKVSVSIAFRIRDVGQPDITIETLDEMYDFVRNEVLGKCLQLHRMPEAPAHLYPAPFPNGGTPATPAPGVVPPPLGHLQATNC